MLQRMEYPRPQLRRESWLPLNGEWEFAFDDDKCGERLGYPTGKVPLGLRITVPFAYQTEASGIHDETDHAVVWYRRHFSADPQRRAVLFFNGCDYETEVYLNGTLVAFHRGGYTPFSADVSGKLGAENVLVVKCSDEPREDRPRGKQSWKGSPFACWYVPTTGIFGSVWLEYTGEDYVRGLPLFPDYDGCALAGEVHTCGRADGAEISVFCGGELLAREKFSLTGERTPFRVSLGRDPASLAWSPACPRLLDVEAVLFCKGEAADTVRTRFGLRKLGWDDRGNFTVNGEPVYLRLVLDQGYWPQSGLTPPSAEALKADILAAQAMGFNGARKHQKIEDPYFNYYAEELGFLTWCEMPSCYVFTGEAMKAFLDEWTEIVSLARSCTNVICYVPFNESWGVPEVGESAAEQEFVRAVCSLTRALDPTRPISANDGWECLTESDLIGVHDYVIRKDFTEKYDRSGFDTFVPQGKRLMAEGNSYRGQPVLLTEFGGIARKQDVAAESWGYGDAAADDGEFYARYRDLLEGIYACGFAGFCYTQLTDVQQEVNGLLRYDRTPKFDSAVLRSINETYGKIKE